DIGRHNALDKLYGYCLKNNITVHDKVIIFSGRMSSEVLTKVSKIGVGIVLSKSAPTDLALRLAEDLNITAVGFIRRGMFNIYSHTDRVSGGNKEEYRYALLLFFINFTIYKIRVYFCYFIMCF